MKEEELKRQIEQLQQEIEAKRLVLNSLIEELENEE